LKKLKNESNFALLALFAIAAKVLAFGTQI
jgi:hypothetical protein